MQIFDNLIQLQPHQQIMDATPNLAPYSEKKPQHRCSVLSVTNNICPASSVRIYMQVPASSVAEKGVSRLVGQDICVDCV
jgi:hypothetical protein